jgi:HEAT repeat protein
MSRRRRKKKLFGPLLYSTLAIGALVVAWSGVMIYGPMILAALRDWHELRSLVAATESQNPNGRARALSGLAERGAAVSVPYLVAAARDPSAEVRATALGRLADVAAEPRVAVPLLVTGAAGGPDSVCIEAARALGRVAATSARHAPATPGARSGLPADLQRDAIRVLVSLLRDSDRTPEVRAASASALAEFRGDPAIVPALSAVAAGDADRAVRLAAAMALQKAAGVDEPGATQALLTLLADPEAVEDRAVVLQSVMLASPQIQERAVIALAGLLSRADPVIRPEVLEMLGSLGPQASAALPALEALSRDSDSAVRAMAGMAMVAIDGPASQKGIAVLVVACIDPTVPLEWRHAALEKIAVADPPAFAAVTPGLIRQLGHSNRDVRLAALELLSMIVPDTPAWMPQRPADGK